MRNSKYRKLRRNPLVRFLRWAYKLFRVLFRTKKNPKGRTPEISYHHISSDDQSDFDSLPIAKIEPIEIENPFPTVGELLGKVQWQLGENIARQEVEIDPPEVSTQPVHQFTISKRNNFAALAGVTNPKDQSLTAMKLLQEVKWQLSLANTQVKALDLSQVSRPQDVSRN